MSREEAIKMVEAALEAYVEECMSGDEYAPEVYQLGCAWAKVLRPE